MNNHNLKQTETVFASRVKSIRDYMKLTQQQVSDYTGIYRSKIVRFENSTVSANIEELLALSSLFGVSVDYLLGLENYPDYMYDLANYFGMTLKQVNDSYRSGSSFWGKDTERDLQLLKLYISVEDELNKFGLKNYKEVSKVIENIISTAINNVDSFNKLSTIINEITEENNPYKIILELNNESKEYLVRFIKSLVQKE